MNKDCVSLEVPQKLQKAGYKSECEYIVTGGDIYTKYSGIKFDDSFFAPTATQLAEELPWQVNGFELRIEKNKDSNFQVAYYEIGYEDEIRFDMQVAKLPDALGLMLCYLLENELIK